MLYVLLGIIVLAVMAVGLTQTQWFRNYLRDMIVDQANESLNGSLAIERLSGPVFGSVTLHGIMLTQTRDTVATIESITVDFDLWSLLNKSVMIEHLIIAHPHLNLVQRGDGTWNIAAIATAPSPADSTATDTVADFKWTIALADVRINDGSAQIISSDSLIPTRIDRLDLRAEGVYSTEKQSVTVNELRFAASEPSFHVEELRASVSFVDSTAVFDTVVVTTEYNRISAAGRYEFRAIPSGRLVLSVDSLDLRDLARFAAVDLPPVQPSLRLDAKLIQDSLKATVTVQDREQHVTVSGWAAPLLRGLTDTTGTTLSYDVQTDLKVKRVQQWVSDTLATGDVDGTISLRGSGLDPRGAAIDANLRISRASIRGFAIDSAHVVGTYTNDSADVDLSARGPFGALTFTGTLAAMTDRFRYNIELTTQRLNVQSFFDHATPETDLSMHVAARGEDYEPTKATGRASVSMVSAQVGEARFDTLTADIQFNPNLITIDTFYIVGPPGSLAGSGTLGLDRRGSFRVQGDIGEVNWLSAWLDTESLGLSGHIMAQIDGSFDSLGVSGTLAVSHLQYDTYTADSLTGQFGVVYADSVVHGNYQLRIDNLAVSDYLIPTTSVSGTVTPAHHTADLRTQLSSNISLALQADYRQDSIAEILASNIRLLLGDQEWTSQDKSARLRLAPDFYELSNVWLVCANTDYAKDSPEEQSVAIEGTYHFDSTHTVAVSTRNVALAPLITLIDPTQSIGGYLSLDLTSTGAVTNPELHGIGTIRMGGVNEYRFDSLSTKFSVTEHLARANATLHVQGPESLVVALTVPVAMLTDTTARAPDTGLDLRVRSYGFTLSILRAFGYTVENAEGDLSIDIGAIGSLDDPRFEGTVRLTDGRVRAPSYGVDYRNIGALIRFDSTRADLTELVVHRDNGTLRATGTAEFGRGLLSGRLDAADLRMTANEFYVVRHNHYEVQISADASIGGPVTDPEYGGTITVRRSNVYLPALSQDISEGSSASVPILVAALGDTAVAADTMSLPAPTPSDTTAAIPSDYLKNLRGRLTIRFPRNTWLRDDDMNIEIEGQLDVVKDGPEFELFGTIDVVRGDYRLYGKKFRIEEGRLTFEGGATVNPRLAIDAIYTFRTPAREKRDLTLSIGGRAESPTLSFTLDGTQIGEGDAVSYIVFGRSIAELTSGQRSAISDEGDTKTEIAKGAIASLLAGQLTETLGSGFNLDVIEINAQSDWKSASFVVGKYITTDLFVSYQRGLGATRDDDEIVPEVVTLEYELSRHLFFQLVAADARKSGFDIILKFDRD
ncbi:MAG: hypothetical protein Kow0074_13200 [Candidatus Zixiibacteriota bacterium]